jgi:CheY-like chemotaxis protein
MTLHRLANTPIISCNYSTPGAALSPQRPKQPARCRASIIETYGRHPARYLLYTKAEFDDLFYANARHGKRGTRHAKSRDKMNLQDDAVAFTSSVRERMNSENPIVFVVDDDRRICEALSDLLSTYGFRVVAFGSAAEYISYPKPASPACLILDVELPGLSGLDLQRQLEKGSHPHVVFLTGHGDIPSSVRAMKAGAVDFLTKPFCQADLIRAVDAARGSAT